MKHRLFITALCSFAIIATMQAQHELSFSAFGGNHPLSLSLNDKGTNSGGFGFGCGVGYNFNFNKTWSIGLGADISFYSASLKFNPLKDTHTAYDEFEDDDFTFTATATRFSENVSALLLEVPITARYTLPIGYKNSLRITGGVKFGLPMNCSYAASAENLHTKGEFHHLERQPYENVPGVFVNEPMGKHTGSWNANVSIQLTLEAAYRFAMGVKSGLSVGAYLNYGLNNIQNKNDTHPITFDIYGSNPYSSNSILNSKFASSVKPMAIGLRLRFDFGL